MLIVLWTGYSLLGTGRQAAVNNDAGEVVHWTAHSSAEVTVLSIT